MVRFIGRLQQLLESGFGLSDAVSPEDEARDKGAGESGQCWRTSASATG